MAGSVWDPHRSTFQKRFQTSQFSPPEFPKLSSNYYVTKREIKREGHFALDTKAN